MSSPSAANRSSRHAGCSTRGAVLATSTSGRPGGTQPAIATESSVHHNDSVANHRLAMLPNTA